MAAARQRSRGTIAAAGSSLGTDKLYFKIGEVAEIVGVAAHVLRYWESEFPTIKPHKSRSQQRVYRRKDVETLLKIKHLLYDRKFTIAGARQELRKGADKVESAPVAPEYRIRQSLMRVREQLDQLKAAIRSDERGIAADPAGFLRSGEGQPQPLLEREPRGERDGS